MTLLDYPSPPRSSAETSPGVDALTTVLCGSFRRSPELLKACFGTLTQAFRVLSPTSIDFVDFDAEFVRLSHEMGESVGVIEDRHLEALKSADFVWLHAPDGYVGVSAAMELGQARALGIPVFATELPTDPVIAAGVARVGAMRDVNSKLIDHSGMPGLALRRLQLYYDSVAQRRGWSGESARDTLLLLTEELGELARSVRKLEGLARHQPDMQQNVGQELADMQLYLVHLANGLGLDLAGVVTAKERVNAERFDSSRVA